MNALGVVRGDEEHKEDGKMRQTLGAGLPDIRQQELSSLGEVHGIWWTTLWYLVTDYG